MIKESFEYNSDIVNDLSSPGKPEDASFMREAIRLSQLAEYYGAAEPPVRCGESHLSGLTEPPQFVY